MQVVDEGLSVGPTPGGSPVARAKHHVHIGAGLRGGGWDSEGIKDGSAEAPSGDYRRTKETDEVRCTHAALGAQTNTSQQRFFGSFLESKRIHGTVGWMASGAADATATDARGDR